MRPTTMNRPRRSGTRSAIRPRNGPPSSRSTRPRAYCPRSLAAAIGSGASGTTMNAAGRYSRRMKITGGSSCSRLWPVAVRRRPNSSCTRAANGAPYRSRSPSTIQSALSVRIFARPPDRAAGATATNRTRFQLAPTVSPNTTPTAASGKSWRSARAAASHLHRRDHPVLLRRAVRRRVRRGLHHRAAARPDRPQAAVRRVHRGLRRGRRPRLAAVRPTVRRGHRAAGRRVA